MAAANRCKDHPSYGGSRKPTSDCDTCLKIWEEQEAKRASSPTGSAYKSSPFDLHDGSEEMLLQLRKEGCSQAQCAEALQEEFGEDGFTKSAVNRRLRKLAMSGTIDLGKLKAFIKKSSGTSTKRGEGVSVIEVANKFNVSPNEAKKAIEQLQEGKTLLEVTPDGEKVLLSAAIPSTNEPFVIDWRKYKEEIVPVGCVADTHLASKYERLDALNNFYDRCKSEGVELVYHGGNNMEGESKFNRFELACPAGFDEQVDYFITNYPQRKGIQTHFITGDDHEGWYVQREHINVGEITELKAHEAGRRDLVYLGHIEKDIEFKQEHGSAIFRVIHAGGGSAYAWSYTSQKYVEMLQGGEKPKFVLVGHFHKYDWSYPREVHVLQPGSFKDQDTWMRKKRLQSIVGGCIVWLRQNELGIFTSVKVEFFPYYDKRFYMFKWRADQKETQNPEK
jgi:predicted phosphodiesterase